MNSEMRTREQRAADLIVRADALIVTDGAGMGVDSGLPDFRGPEGFWGAYPALGRARIRFEDIANPQAFEDDPHLAWGFYGHRLNRYRATQPHEGFRTREDPWSEAVQLLTRIAVRSRELVTDKFKPRELKIADISVPDYIAAMDVLGDGLKTLIAEKGWKSPWVASRALDELEALDAFSASEANGPGSCQWIIELIKGKKKRA